MENVILAVDAPIYRPAGRSSISTYRARLTGSLAVSRSDAAQFKQAVTADKLCGKPISPDLTGEVLTVVAVEPGPAEFWHVVASRGGKHRRCFANGHAIVDLDTRVSLETALTLWAALTAEGWAVDISKAA
jgi:hypothetical protein